MSLSRKNRIVSRRASSIGRLLLGVLNIRSNASPPPVVFTLLNKAKTGPLLPLSKRSRSFQVCLSTSKPIAGCSPAISTLSFLVILGGCSFGILLTISIGRRPIPQCCTEKDKRLKNPAPFYLYCSKKSANSDMRMLFSGLLLALALIANAQQPTDSLLDQLTQAIGKAPGYDSAKTKRIDRLRANLPAANAAANIANQTALFDGYE